DRCQDHQQNYVQDEQPVPEPPGGITRFEVRRPGVMILAHGSTRPERWNRASLTSHELNCLSDATSLPREGPDASLATLPGDGLVGPEGVPAELVTHHRDGPGPVLLVI